MAVSFDVGPREAWLIRSIAERAVALAELIVCELDVVDVEMDLTACHANGCPLDLGRLLAAGENDLMHDVLGVRRHLDRSTGQLRDHFVPRFARQMKEV